MPFLQVALERLRIELWWLLFLDDLWHVLALLLGDADHRPRRAARHPDHGCEQSARTHACSLRAAHTNDCVLGRMLGFGAVWCCRSPLHVQPHRAMHILRALPLLARFCIENAVAFAALYRLC